MARLCCRARRTAGGEDYTDTQAIDLDELAELSRPVYPPAAVWAEPYTAARKTRELRLADLVDDQALALGRAVATAAYESAAADGDQLAGDPGLAAAVRAAELAGRAGIRLPVARRPWRRVWCWMTGGHQWFPSVAGCLDCGKPCA